MRLNWFEKLLGSGLYTGYIPIVSGTFGSAAAVLIYLIPGFESLPILISAIIVFSIVGIFIGNKFESVYGKDPSQCTIDEFVGTWISLILVPKTFTCIMITFFIWRIFDIIKPFPARNFEKIPGGLGIMMDDIASALYTLVTIHIILKILVFI